MTRSLVVLAVLLPLLSCVQKEPGEVDAVREGDLAPCRYETVLHRGAYYDVVRVNLEYADVRMYWKRTDGSRIATFPALRDWVATQGQRLLVATNGGIFLKGFIPEGVHVERGTVVTPTNDRSGWGNFYLKPNGVFAILRRGAVVVTTNQFVAIQREEEVIEATQSGPMLVDHGMIHPVFEDSSFHYNIRSGVAAPRPNEVILAISRVEVTLYDFATFFRDKLKCNDALYLEGDITRMYAPELGRFDTGSCAGIIGVVARSR